ncbi:MAG: ABC transporter substrate-binding protein [Treponema sp.]|nr:ABC transporter substrate-binding protein [Treponema sp.]
MKKNCLLFAAGLLFLLVGCKKSNAKVESAANSQSSLKFLASTSWTAGFMDIAGVDGVEIIAPASLRHPPEYEVTVSDIQKINDSSYFVYAGFERMMKTLGDAVTADSKMIKIKCDNSIESVSSEAKKLAEIFGTQDECKKRLEEYCAVVEKGKNRLTKEGLAGAKVFCNKNQIYLAKDLGLELAQTFGPGEVTSEQIAFAKEQDFVFIIDNVHNPVGGPLFEVAPDAKYVVWRNFPETVERASLKKVIESNIDCLFKKE